MKVKATFCLSFTRGLMGRRLALCEGQMCQSKWYRFFIFLTMLYLHKYSFKLHNYVIHLYASKETGTALVRPEVQGKQIFL
jgi:hypothetical protein